MGLDPSLNLILAMFQGKEKKLNSFVRWTLESSIFSMAKSRAKRERKYPDIQVED